ncbi:MAG: PilW family protein [Gammaproteobacteria bacterium]
MTASKQFTTSMTANTQRGLTLVELMIAMLIGLFLLVGTLTVFQQSRSNFRVADSIARLQENARFALDIMEPDIRLASFWGRSSEPGLIDTTIPGAVVVNCDTVDNSAGMNPPTTYTQWTLNFLASLQVVDESSGYGHNVMGIPCGPATAPQPQSDALVVRHASGQQIPATPNVIQVQTDLTRGQIFNDGAVPGGYDPASQTHNVVANVYYVNATSDLDPNSPSLRVKTLVPGGIHQDQELMSGVENLQIQVGIDTDGDMEVERYVDPDHDAINPTTAGTIAGAQIIAVRLWMLMRSDRPEVGFTDTLTYTTPDPDFNITPCAPGAGCRYPNDHRRLAVSKTMLLRNSQ